jgi:hypothetical protein
MQRILGLLFGLCSNDMHEYLVVILWVLAVFAVGAIVVALLS